MVIGSAVLFLVQFNEHSNDPAFAGTWTQLVPLLPISTELDSSFEGIFQFIRARIATISVGGTITVNYIISSYKS
jgi:hypothetical protein